MDENSFTATFPDYTDSLQNITQYEENPSLIDLGTGSDDVDNGFSHSTDILGGSSYILSPRDVGTTCGRRGGDWPNVLQTVNGERHDAGYRHIPDFVSGTYQAGDYQNPVYQSRSRFNYDWRATMVPSLYTGSTADTPIVGTACSEPMERSFSAPQYNQFYGEMRDEEEHSRTHKTMMVDETNNDGPWRYPGDRGGGYLLNPHVASGPALHQAKTHTFTQYTTANSGVPIVTLQESDNPTPMKSRRYLKKKHPCKHGGCPMIFSDKRDLRRHNDTHRPPPEGLYRCRYSGCPVRSKRVDNLKRHEKKKHGRHGEGEIKRVQIPQTSDTGGREYGS